MGKKCSYGEVLACSGFYLVLPTKTIFTSHYSVDNVFYCSQDTTHISTRHVHNIYGRISAACCPMVADEDYAVNFEIEQEVGRRRFKTLVVTTRDGDLMAIKEYPR
ncbi:hypothetical protein M8J75_007400 [Diaphorina citri]|nr:hypothetical protein M8J75_007400 [Diaphorina citri]